MEQVLDIKKTLKEVFGYSQFRGTQEEIIENILQGKNTFVLMPTGAGKSMCYQLPAILSEGTAIVISPLIALMKNQVDQMNAVGVNAQFLNSTLSKTEINRVKRETLNGNIKLLYVAPESLTKPDNIAFLKTAKISFAAIDEAHCISEWGHDFRPEYRRIKAILAELGNLPAIALTATATPKVQLDIQRNLQMEDADLFKSSFNRANLYYEVRSKHQAKKQLISFIKKHHGKSGIIYCLSRKKVEEIAEFLRVNDVKAAPYHAGLDSAIRIKNQDGFLNEDIDVIVATIAFGMGIDKPDVRFVVHFDTPKSLEGYYQETGRGGRDGLEGNCLMFYSYDDILKLEKFSKDKPVTERDTAKLLLEEMASYAESSVCRRRQLLHYFGESFEKDCGFCDNCVNPKEKFEGMEYATLVLEAAKQTNERFGIKHLANVVKGNHNQYIKSYQHDELDVFAKGKDQSEEFWVSVARQVLLHEYLRKDIESTGVVKLTDKGRDFLKTPQSISLSKDHDYVVEGEPDEIEPRGGGRAYNKALFSMLKDLRKKVAKQKQLPPYVIFHDPSLEEMATTFPTSRQELSQINGVGMGKVTKFGQPFIDLIEKFVDDNDITTATDVVIKSSVNKSKIKIFIIQQVDRKIDLDEIAEAQNIKMDALITEIENISDSGTKLNLDYYIEHIMDDQKQEDIINYFLDSEDHDIDAAIDEFEEDDISEEEVRLMHVKFMSDHAN